MFLASPIQANEFLGLKSWINSFTTPDFSQRKIRLPRALIKNNRLNKIQINKEISTEKKHY